MVEGILGRLRRVCCDAMLALSASGVGVNVASASGLHGMVTASDPATERIEELQFIFGEGPCVDAYTANRPVMVPDLADGATSRWPVYTPAVHDAGIRAVFAFPIQVGAARLGVLDVFRTYAGHLSADEVGRALTFTELAVTTLLDAQAHATTALDEAIDHSAELFQAQGMVMVQLGVPIAEALIRIRAYAFAENLRVNDVAADIVARRLHFDQERP